MASHRALLRPAQSARWPRRSLPAWAMSLVMHAVLLSGATYWFRFAPRGAGPAEEGRTVGVALVTATQGEVTYEAASEATSHADGDEATGDWTAALPASRERAVDLSGVLPSADDDLGLGALLAAPAPNASAGTGRALNDHAARVRTHVFGTSGSGSNFIYVFDRSGSMAGFGGRPLTAAKRELIASLQDLQETNQFQIIFYNEEPHVFRLREGTPSLVWGTEAAKAAAARFVQGIAASGSTRHLEPLRMALNLRPDVIFFLTDADEPELTRDELQKVRHWNQGSLLNAIEFGFGPQVHADNFLIQLAQQNGGQYVYVDVALLDSRPAAAQAGEKDLSPP